MEGSIVNIAERKKDWQFDNGLSLTYRHYPQYPIASVSINVLDAGSYQEETFQQNHLIEHLVYMAMKPHFANEPDVYMSAQTNLESAQYTCRLPAAKIINFLNHFEFAVNDPDTFKDEIIEREKQAIKNELNKPGNACNDLLPLLGWAQGVKEDWNAFDSLSSQGLKEVCTSSYISHKLHLEIAGNLSAEQLDNLISACFQLEKRLAGKKTNNVQLKAKQQASRIVISPDKHIVGYFCDLHPENNNAYLTMACAYHLFHASSSLGIYHNLRFDKGFIYNLIRAYHLFNGRSQFALFAQVQPQSSQAVADELKSFFSQSNEQLFEEHLPWAAQKCLSSQMISMETLSEVTKRASQHYVNYQTPLDENAFYQYLQPHNLGAVKADIQSNFFTQELEVISYDRD